MCPYFSKFNLFFVTFTFQLIIYITWHDTGNEFFDQHKIPQDYVNPLLITVISITTFGC